MSAPTPHSTVADLVKAFANADADDLGARFAELADAVWSDNGPTELSAAAVPVIITHLDLVGLDDLADQRRGYLTVLLGLLAESEYPAFDGPVATAVRAGLDRYLQLLYSADEPLRLAALYLLEHLQLDAERVLAAAGSVDLPPEESTRLQRALIDLDPDDPYVGRIWPAPSVWQLTPEEKEFDRQALASLTPEQLLKNWHNDTLTVYAYSGAKAYWAVRHGEPTPETAVWEPRTEPDATALGSLPTGLLDWHSEVYKCPSCAAVGSLEFDEAGDRTRCGGCSAAYPVAGGIADLAAAPLTEQTADDDDDTANLLQKLAAMPSMGLYYEAVLRPAYLRIAGSNWGTQVTPEDEDRYIAAQIRPTDGPVLDLAAGAGRWTRVVVEAVGAERVIALDMAPPMLKVLRGALPDVPAVLASALDLPFDDGSLGAINCWNALQAFPDDAEAAIAEMGRCLKPGGTLTMLTYSWDDDPIGKYFQASHFFPSRPAGHLLFGVDELDAWFESAGMQIVDLQRPGTFVLLTAERIQ